MINLWQFAVILAEEQPAQQPPPGGGIFMWLFPALIIFFIFQLMFGNPNRKEQRHIDDLKSKLKKNDAVVTAGGIIGTVANLHPERNEITIKVDDNTRLRMQMRSVYAVPKPDDGKAKPEQKSDDSSQPANETTEVN